jgi:hypothetical protein
MTAIFTGAVHVTLQNTRAFFASDILDLIMRWRDFHRSGKMAEAHAFADIMEQMTATRDDKSRLRLLKAWYVYDLLRRCGVCKGSF